MNGSRTQIRGRARSGLARQESNTRPDTWCGNRTEINSPGTRETKTMKLQGRRTQLGTIKGRTDHETQVSDMREGTSKLEAQDMTVNDCV